MRCPRCNHEIEAKQSSCVYCGFVTAVSPPREMFVEEPGSRREETDWRQRAGSDQTSSHGNEVTASRYFQPDEQWQKRTMQPSLASTHFMSKSSPQNAKEAQPSVASQPMLPLSSSQAASEVQEELPFPPGSLLGGGRYQIISKQEHQQWGNGAYETCWQAQDLHQGKANVSICELGLPEMRIVTRQAYLRAAMKELFQGGMHLRTPALTNVFRESGRDFFVFNSPGGETLAARLQRSGQPLQEREITACCLQITEVLEAMAGQEPPLIHGLISPKHLLITHTGQWFLTGFSVVLASGAKEYITNRDPAIFSAFSAPEFTKGIIDSRSDLYALLATAYFSITGKLFARAGGNNLWGQPLPPYISPSFDAILKKGLHPNANQRYQRVSDLRQDLLALRASSSTAQSVAGSEQGRNIQPIQEQVNVLPASLPGKEGRVEATVAQSFQGRQSYVPEMQPKFDPVAQVLTSLASSDEKEVAGKNFLPRPEELPPMRQGNDLLTAMLWMGAILVCLFIPLFIK